MKNPQKSFYAQGLPFDCTACGKCCSNHNGYDNVYLTDQDIFEIRAQLELTKKDFLKTYARREHGQYILKEEKTRCVFLKPNGHCKVYEARPLQCRTFPFWPENLNPQTWHQEIERDCPGAGEGAPVPLKQIETYLRWDQEERYKEEGKPEGA